jgi:hypothetical protein
MIAVLGNVIYNSVLIAESLSSCFPLHLSLMGHYHSKSESEFSKVSSSKVFQVSRVILFISTVSLSLQLHRPSLFSYETLCLWLSPDSVRLLSDAEAEQKGLPNLQRNYSRVRYKQRNFFTAEWIGLTASTCYGSQYRYMNRVAVNVIQFTE